MDLFGLKEHDARHDELERTVRRLVEQVAQLTIDLGVTRTELRKLRLVVDGKVSADDIDPAVDAMNQGLKVARTKLAAAEEAAEEKWSALNAELSEAIAEVRQNWEQA